MDRYERLIKKANELDPNVQGVAEVQQTGWNTKYPYLVALKFPQRQRSNPNYNSCVTVVSGMDLESAEEFAGLLNQRKTK